MAFCTTFCIMNNAHSISPLRFFFFSIILLLFRYLSQNCHVCSRFFFVTFFSLISSCLLCYRVFFLCTKIELRQSLKNNFYLVCYTSYCHTLFQNEMKSILKSRYSLYAHTKCNVSFSLQQNAFH